jgi:hypothetical protein
MLHLVLDRVIERGGQFLHGEGLHALKAAGLGDAGIGASTRAPPGRPWANRFASPP